MASFTQPNDVWAILDALGLNLTKEQKRRIEEAAAMVDTNNRSLEDFLGNTTQLFPLLTADPVTPENGQVWINTTTDTVKIRKAGVTKTFTVT